jgi:hypothetical protein
MVHKTQKAFCMQKAFCLDNCRQHLFLVEMPPDIFYYQITYAVQYSASKSLINVMPPAYSSCLMRGMQYNLLH